MIVPRSFHSSYLWPLGVLLAALFLLVSGRVQLLQSALFDQYQRWFPLQTPASELVEVVDIDEASLAHLGQWPWPRDVLARLQDRLHAAGARVVAWDMLFAERDRTSPALLADNDKVPASLRPVLRELPDHDDLFAASLRRGSSVLSFSLADSALPPDESLPAARFLLRGEADIAIPHSVGAIFPLPQLQGAATVGSINFLPDEDGVVRRVPMVVRVGDVLAPALSLEVLRRVQNAGSFVIQPHAVAGLEVRVGRLGVPMSPSGEAWVYFAPSRQADFLPAWQVFEDDKVLSRLRNRIVLVGSSAAALMDLRFGPFPGVVPGVEVHALLIAQALGGQALVRPQSALAGETLLLLTFGLLFAHIGLRLPALVSASVAIVCISVLLAFSVWMFARHGYLIDALSPAVLALLVFVVATVLSHRDTEARQRWVRAVFSRYVSPNLVDYIVSHPESLTLGGTRRECSFIFTDVAGYTTLLEQQDPAAVVNVVNAYLDGMIEIAFKHGGTLTAVMGDGLVIMFSAPVVQPDHAQRALRCALKLHAFASEFARQCASDNVAWGETRIGVNSGEVIVGNFGGSSIFDYAALGDPINTASRLEGANKYLGTRILASDATVAASHDIITRPVGELILKGRREPLTVHEVCALREANAYIPDGDLYLAAYAQLQRGDDLALDTFEQLALMRPDDPLVGFHYRRLAAGESGSVVVLRDK